MSYLLNKFFGHTIIADAVYTLPESSEGWIANNSDVIILLTFINGTSVQLAAGQTHSWSNRNSFNFQGITVTVTGMTTGFVGCCWSV